MLPTGKVLGLKHKRSVRVVVSRKSCSYNQDDWWEGQAVAVAVLLLDYFSTDAITI
jgi:hypothetical protein